MHDTKVLHELCETISREIEEANDKIRKAGGKLSAGDVDYIDKLTHTMKSLKTTIAMVEADEGESGRYMPHYGGRYSYNDGYDYDMSHAMRRDSMGRYTSRRSSYSDGMAEELRALMEDAPDEATKKEFRRFISKIESM